jgi:uncharacterized protein (DUF1015 family)
MTTLVPLDARVARGDRIDEIVAPQYDSLAHGGRYQYAVDRPDCFLNVVLSRADFPEGELREADIAQRAADHFSQMVQRGLFPEHEGHAFFLYELDTGTHVQTGLMAGISTDAISDGTVLGHEGTIHDRAVDLAEFYRRSRLTSSPVALAFDATDAQQAILDRHHAGEPLRDFTAWDGVRQRLWAINNPDDVAELQDAMESVEAFYITDGHHRVAASQEDGAVPGWFLGVVFPAHQMQVLEYNRCVSMGAATNLDELRNRLGTDWEIEPLGPAGETDARPTGVGEFSMLLDHDWHRLRFVGERPDDPVGGLDVCLLHDRILGPGFGVDNDADDRLSFVVGADAGPRLEEVVRSVPGTVAFALYPTSVGELFDVADAGRMMPANSTWFTPKPRSGLIVVTW